jgi:WD40 repeat protein
LDAEVPTEFFTYVARDGSQPTKVTERNDRIVCPFTRQWLLLYRASRYRPDGSSIGSLIRHDLRGGHEIVVVRDVDNRYALSPDATKLVYVNRGQEALRLLDLDTLQRRTLAGPETDVLYSHGGPGEGDSGLRWAPDGRRIGYFTGFRPRGASWNSRLHRYEHAFRVVDIDTGSTVTRLRIAGGPPSVAWSPDSTRLLICARDRAHESNCGAGPGRLLLVDLRAGSVQTVARGPLNLVGWSPSGTTFAYATPRALFLVTAAGTRRLPTMKPLGPCGVECPWLGWSPNGRYIGFDAGLTEKPPGGIQLIDVRTGRLRVLRPVGPGYYLGISWLTR